MKRFARRAVLAATAVGAVLALGLATITVVHAVATSVESDRIEPYGTPATVDGKRMNVVVAGEGPDIVLLPGFGTASPALDFAPLVAELAVDYRVTVVEPFGYGLSDGTAAERTTANIVTEIHDAVAALGLERYTLMGHAIAGIYGIDYANRYPDEVTAFVGIDTSAPGQPGMDAEFPTGFLAVAKSLGLVRLVAAVSDDDYRDAAYSEHDREQLAMLSNRNLLSPTYLNEMAHTRRNFADAAGTGFPRGLRLLLFVAANNESNPGWLNLHEEQAGAASNGTVVPINGEHYLHYSHSGGSQWGSGRGSRAARDPAQMVSSTPCWQDYRDHQGSQMGNRKTSDHRPM